MSIKKVMGYGRYVMIAVLFCYIILVWMYFKDNAVQLTSKGLLLWFVLIPLILVFIIIMTLWRQKKSERKILTPSLSKNKEQPAKQPNIYNVYIKSSLYLPEGDSWADIIANEEDLTILSKDFSDFDGLPILTKPIAYVITDPDSHNRLIQSTIPNPLEDNFNDEYLEDQVADLDDLTQRLSTMIQQLLLSNEDTLTLLVEHFAMLNYDKTHEPNSAIHIHPEWQQHYIASAADSDPENTASTLTSQTELSFFICLPALANTDIVTTIVKQQLLSYGLLEHHYTIATIHLETDGDAAEFAPESFINNRLVTLSRSLKAEVCFLIVADSQINQQWLESDQYLDTKHNIVPTEASTLLIFSNEVAQEQLDMTSNNFLFTDINELLASDDTLDKNTAINSSFHYAKSLENIKQILFNNNFDLSALNKLDAKNSSLLVKRTTIPEQIIAEDSLLNNQVIALSDINPSTQPYDLSAFIEFVNSFNQKDALVNEHHLGHYMPLNVWLKSFIAVALLVDIATENKHPLEYRLLITQSNHHCTLWLADHAEDK